MSAYISAIHAAAMIFLVSAIMLFLQHKRGERSRVILGFFILLSVVNYLTRELALRGGEMPLSVVTVQMLLLGILMTILFLIYPAEVIAPGWVTLKRLLMGCSPIALLYLIYLLTLWMGVEYTPYYSLLEMMPHIGDFDVLFRLFLCVLIFVPPFLLYSIPFTREYSNTDLRWVRNYIIIVAIKNIAYIAVLFFESMPVHIAYYYISFVTMLYLVYIELFIRIIPLPAKERAAKVVAKTVVDPSGSLPLCPKDTLFQKLESYLHETEVWRDPELTLERLAIDLKTNRTSLWQAIVDEGFSYNYYIAKIRIEAYIAIIRENPACRYMNAFYEVGYRSTSTALRNFKMITGTTPTLYFQQEFSSQA